MAISKTYLSWGNEATVVKRDFTNILKMGGGLLSDKEADLLYETGLEINAHNIVEIGARMGGSSMLLGMMAKETGGHVQSIEIHPRPVWYENIQKAGLTEYVTLIEGESPWIDLSLITTSIDLLFIDGEHFVPECLVDYWYWNKFVRSGGIIAFHDWSGKGGGVGDMVQRAVGLILERHALVEIGRIEGYFGLIVFRKL